MSSSQFDNERLSEIDRNAINHYQQQYENAKTQEEKDSWHRLAEEIRRKNGYSGGGNGGQYIPVDVYDPPSLPDIPDYHSQWDSQMNGIFDDLNNIDPYESQYQGQINSILDDLQNRPDYRSPYEDMIQEQLDKIMNRPDFSYDPEQDKAYQAYKQQAYRLGDQSYENMLGQYAANTGGRLNSWASSMSSEARNNYRLQAEMGVTQYEDRAFQRYQYESANLYNQMSTLQNLDSMEFNKYQASYNNQLNLLSSIQNLDASAYRQYRDQITDKYELANIVMTLDNQDFQKYAYMVDNTWRQFEAETTNYQNALQFKQNEWQKAMDNTNLLGYVNNEASYVLGVPTGTLSADSRQRMEQMEDYFAMQEYSFNNWTKTEAQSHEFEKQLLELKFKNGYALNDYEYSRELGNLGGMINSATPFAKSSNVVQNALNYKGVPYSKSGGKSFKSIDCSGLVQNAYEEAGITFPVKRVTSQNMHDSHKNFGFVKIPLSEVRPGDVLWNQGHLALAYDANNVIEASSTKGKVVIQTMWNRNTPFKEAYRYVGK